MHPQTLLDAIAELWALFDSATVQANVAFEQYGLPDRVVVEDTNVDRRYCLADPEGPERAVTVSLAMPVPDGFSYGGAFVGISRTRSTMYLTPEVDGAHVQWIVPASHTVFTTDIVHDLFLSVFADDPAATYRLSPLASRELFQSPWS